MTAEQHERWHIRDCARCGRRAAKAANWPDGSICRTVLPRLPRAVGGAPAAASSGCCQADRPMGETSIGLTAAFDSKCLHRSAQ
jgi:hypothetical protein